MYDFITDLDEYFCEKYANYDKLCVLEGYRMPKMQTSEVRADGRTYAYTLPASTMRLAAQEQKAELLIALKKQMFDKTVSFSFRPMGFFARCKNRYSKYGFFRIFRLTMAKYNHSLEEVGAELDIMPEIWRGICKGKYLPTKNLIFSMALSAHLSLDDTKNLLAVCGYELDFTVVKDVVVAYLLGTKVYNAGMIDAALAEYKVENLYLKREKTEDNA
ncbi:MAG: hypothetical protein IJ514_05960 [Clostridia bacterium]|nr:hypothetical protein [Clostridia bacterium]